MEEIKLFEEISKVKLEIEKDLGIMSKIENHLNFQMIEKDNKESSQKFKRVNEEYNKKLNELRNKNNSLLENLNSNEKMQIKLQEEIKSLNKLNHDITEDNKTYESQVIELKGRIFD